MSQLTTTKCDQCGALKKEANHWIKLWIDNNTHEFLSFDPNEGRESGDTYFIAFDEQDFCSESCVNKVIHKLLFEQPSKIIVHDNTGSYELTYDRNKGEEVATKLEK